MSIDKQFEELGELKYNGAKAKNFQLYKKLQDMQLKEKYGQYGSWRRNTGSMVSLFLQVNYMFL